MGEYISFGGLETGPRISPGRTATGRTHDAPAPPAAQRRVLGRQRWSPLTGSELSAIGERVKKEIGAGRCKMARASRRSFASATLKRQRHLLRILAKYVDYYNGTRTHLSLAKDAPRSRRVQPPSEGVVEVPRVGGLHLE